MNQRKSTVNVGFLCAALLTALMVHPVAAYAGPGGIIQAVESTWIGRVITVILIVALSPILILDAIRRNRAVKRTTAALSQLAQTLPQYRWLDVTDRITNAYTWTWSAWSHQKMEEASQFTTNWYWQNQQLLLDDWTAKGLTNVCSLKKINSIKPLLVQHNPQNGGEGSRIVVLISATVVDYMQDGQGRMVEGKKEPSDNTTVWTFLYENGEWKLNRIEDLLNLYDYIKMPNEVAVTVPTASI